MSLILMIFSSKMDYINYVCLQAEANAKILTKQIQMESDVLRVCKINVKKQQSNETLECYIQNLINDQKQISLLSIDPLKV